MKTAYPQLCLMTLVIAGLTACGGGGGGGGGSRGVGVTVTPNFTSWSAVAPGSTVVVAGDSQEGTYTFNSSTNTVTARTAGVQQSGAIFTESFSATPPYLAENVRFRTASGTDISFSRGTDTFFVLNINTDFWGVESADETKYALMADPVEIGWDYQSFGIWTTGAGTASGTYGAASVGSPTPAGSIPTSGTATYYGYAGGRHVASDGSHYFTVAAMQTSANFATRQLNFTTPYTEQTPNLYTSAMNGSLNMTGTLNYSPGSNQFTGAVSTAGGMTGSAQGRFYGPAAQEIGGTFSVTGPGVQSYGGAFGGAR
jgi:hypothetical protein